MNETVTVKLPSDLAEWLHERAATTGMSAEEIISISLAVARAKTAGENPFLKHAGVVKGTPPDLSTRKGFDRGER
jgi:hypothetical protein